jgi:MoxR-like ATPase
MEDKAERSTPFAAPGVGDTRTAGKPYPRIVTIDSDDARRHTAIVYLIGYPGVGKRTVGAVLAEQLDGVLVDNQLINIPILTLFRWDGKFLLPPGVFEKV